MLSCGRRCCATARLIATCCSRPFRARLKAWCAHARVSALREDASARLSQLVQRTGEWLIAGRVTEEAAIRLMDWIESLLRRESYLALLLERPAVHERLLHLLGSAKWPARTCCSTLG